MSTQQVDLEDELDDEDLGDKESDDKGDSKGQNEEFDEARARKTIENQRKEEKRLKAALQQASAELKAIKDKDLPAAEKQRKDLEEANEKVSNLTRKMRKSSLRAEVLEQATKLKFRSPSLATRLIDMDEVDWDEDDEPTNVVGLLKDILEEDPSLRGRRSRTASEDDEQDEEGEGDGRKRDSAKSGDFINRQIRKAAGRR